MISGKNVRANDSSSYFGTPLFVSGDGGNPIRSSLFITLRFAAIWQRFYLCRSLLLYFVIPLLLVLIFILPPSFLYRYSLMCQAGRHTRLWMILSSIVLCSIIVHLKNKSTEKHSRKSYNLLLKILFQNKLISHLHFYVEMNYLTLIILTHFYPPYSLFSGSYFDTLLWVVIFTLSCKNRTILQDDCYCNNGQITSRIFYL